MSYQNELRHLRYFIAVAEDLHFRKAADRLYISQPGLSRQIKQLEEGLGIALFERTNRKVALTQAGAYFYKESKLLLKHLDEMAEHSRLLHEGQVGQARFGYVGSAMQTVIPQLLVKIKKEMGHIHFKLDEMDNHQQVAALMNREIDLGFVRLERVPAKLALKPVFEDTFSLVLPGNHPLTEEKFTDLKQVCEEPFILFEQDYSPAYYEKVIQLFENSGFTPLVSHTTVHASTIYRLVERGFGLAIVPTTLKLGYAMDVKFIELSGYPQRTTLSAIWHRKNRNPILKRILEQL